MNFNCFFIQNHCSDVNFDLKIILRSSQNNLCYYKYENFISLNQMC